jgi:hypothetical protein
MNGNPNKEVLVMLFPSSQRFTVENLVIASIAAVTTLVVSVAVPTGSGLSAGDGVQVTPRVATGLTNGIAVYGVIIDATHIGIAFVNASAGAIDPADTFDFDVYVTKKTGAAVASV